MKRQHHEKKSPVCNDHIFQQLSLANDCADALHKLGCHIDRISLGGHAPMIWIDDGDDKLNGAMVMRETHHGQTIVTRVAQLYSCNVRWPPRREEVAA